MNQKFFTLIFLVILLFTLGASAESASEIPTADDILGAWNLQLSFGITDPQFDETIYFDANGTGRIETYGHDPIVFTYTWTGNDIFGDGSYSINVEGDLGGKAGEFIYSPNTEQITCFDFTISGSLSYGRDKMHGHYDKPTGLYAESSEGFVGDWYLFAQVMDDGSAFFYNYNYAYGLTDVQPNVSISISDGTATVHSIAYSTVTDYFDESEVLMMTAELSNGTLCLTDGQYILDLSLNKDGSICYSHDEYTVYLKKLDI